VRDSVDPANLGDIAYIGLEHIAADSLQLTGVGSANEVTSTKTHFDAGDVPFGKLRPYFRKVVQPRFEGVCSTDIWVLRSRETVSQDYLFYLMASPEVVAQTIASSKGTRMPRADWDFLAGYQVAIGSIEEQRRVAGVLGALDDRIKLNRRMCETLEEMAQALFKSWFVDFEPVRAKMEGRWEEGESLPGLPAHLWDLMPDRLVDSRFGLVPQSWHTASLDELATFTNGLALQRFPVESDDWLPVIKIAEMRRGYTDRTDRCSSEIDEQYIIMDGDLLFSWSGSLEVVYWSHGPGALNQHLFKVEPVSAPSWLCWAWLMNHLPHFRAIASDRATTMGHIRRHHLSEALVVVPPNAVIDALNPMVGPLVDQALTLRLMIQRLTVMRDTLLPELISGEIRLPEIAEMTEC